MSALSERKPVREFGETVSRQEETTIKKLQLIIVAHSYSIVVKEQSR